MSKHLFLSLLTLLLVTVAHAQDFKTYKRGGGTQNQVDHSGSILLWADMQFVSTRGSRPEQVGTVIPAVALNYEQHLFGGLGVRAYVSTHWWREEKVLVQAPSIGFTEIFDYQYWAGGLGANWHFATGEAFHPYLGVVASYRYASAVCECSTDSKSGTSLDFFLGARYFFAKRLYLNAEAGQHGTGYAKVGIGLKIR